MNKDKEEIMSIVNEIVEIINSNEQKDGSLNLDTTKVKVALDFAKNQIIKSIIKTN